MWNKIQYALIYSWVKVHALLPMWALYILSDILYVLIYKIIRYRVKVVRQNMKASFPEKSDTELRRLEREFYHHFADYVASTRYTDRSATRLSTACSSTYERNSAPSESKNKILCAMSSP